VITRLPDMPVVLATLLADAWGAITIASGRLLEKMLKMIKPREYRAVAVRRRPL